jgi:hypothetical protein
MLFQLECYKFSLLYSVAWAEGDNVLLGPVPLLCPIGTIAVSNVQYGGEQVG